MNDKKIDSYYEPSWKTSKIEDDIYATKFYVMQKQIDELQQENKQLKDNWEIIRQYCLDEQIPEESDEYNSYIEFSNSVYDNILNKMQEITGVSDDNKTTI